MDGVSGRVPENIDQGWRTGTRHHTIGQDRLFRCRLTIAAGRGTAQHRLSSERNFLDLEEYTAIPVTVVRSIRVPFFSYCAEHRTKALEQTSSPSFRHLRIVFELVKCGCRILT